MKKKSITTNIKKILILTITIFLSQSYNNLLVSQKISNNNNYKNDKIIIDSDYTLQEALMGSTAPDSIIKNLVLLNVEYYSFDKKLHRGQLVLHKELVDDVLYIFNISKKNKFPISKVIPIVRYNWSDSASMLDNNTSAFNYRKVAGSNKLSKHALGKAIDINPMQNPYRGRTGKISPKNAKYNIHAEGTLTATHPIVLELLKRKWTWGGNWKSIKDWQHFEFP